MPHHVPFKTLELTVFSAQDLPPVSKMLRTFAVTYVHPDHKLTTRVDHQGHTNPRWNYKVVFHVDDKFLRHESSAVTIEIYNLAWLRDLPIGTACLLINNLSPPLHKNPYFRRVALRICQPSGHLQGILNLGVQLVENVVPGCEVSVFSITSDEKMDDQYQFQLQSQEGNNNSIKEDDLKDHERNSGAKITSEIENITPTMESRISNGSRPEKNTKITPANSLYSVMRPLSSEVAEDMRKGLYTAEWNDYGSSVFENWTDQSDDRVVIKSESVDWRAEDQIPLKNDKILGLSHPKKRPDKKKGLMSCFANVYGFRFSFICGSNALKKKKKKKNRNVKQNVHLMTIPNENLHGFHV
ncbi:hypothetical protein BUALT_Bualt06G0011600 [Buddleja alternifolia]|uniref:C2 domain-containing protein n=1 Tax=Buddleja alternifolia TaxID=168488 RepID=A0AAV6XK61_9LAMI|nr:hypothetical protein BUALT_Bualt06G0011600 [Buddleja alternifolia]